MCAEGPHAFYAKSSRLKTRLLKEGLLEEVCALCGQLPTWNGKPLVLQLDHENGIPWDNRLSNLRILCGHCHSQQPTSRTYKFTNLPAREKRLKARRVPAATVPPCIDCSGPASRNAVRCRPCNSLQMLKVQPAKIDWPPMDVLLRRLETSTFVTIGRELGVSDTAVRKHIRKRAA